MKEEFISYLDEWEESVEERKGFSQIAKKKMQLSPETFLGIRMTGDYG